MDRLGNKGWRAGQVNRHLFLLAWLGPSLATGVYYLVEGLIVGVRYTRVFGLIMTGQIFVGVASIIVLYLLLFHSPFFRLVFIWVNLGSIVTCVAAMIFVSFQGFRLFLAIATWGFVVGIRLYRADFRAVLDRIPLKAVPAWLRCRFTRIERRRIVASLTVAGLLAVCGMFLLDAPRWNLQEREFVVSVQEARATDIVFYYACGTSSEYSAHHDVIDAAKAYDATLSMAWHVQYFNDTAEGSLGHEIANFTREANAKGVQVEFFPCFHFNWEYILEGGFFSSVAMTLDWYGYWTIFKNWVAREGIEVDYVLWDMEGGSAPSAMASLPGWAGYLPTSRILGLSQRERELPLVRAEFERIIGETEAMGAKTRITTWSPSDALDGDHDLLLLLGQFAYVFDDLIQNGKIEYVSTMAYTNGWGDKNPEEGFGRQGVYECARQLRSLHPDKVGICIGNINGNGLTTIEQVVNEYHLAVAGGATSVRLFNGASWVNGWNYTVVGPAWGANGTRALFEACRQGGTCQFTENPDRTAWQFANELQYDLILNLCKA